jgi:hypothetical protein
VKQHDNLVGNEQPKMHGSRREQAVNLAV